MTFGGHLGSHIDNMKMPINYYFMQKIDKHPSTPSIKHQVLFLYVVSSEMNQNMAVEGLNASCMSFPWTCISLVLASAESNDNTNFYCKDKSCTETHI